MSTGTGVDPWWGAVTIWAVVNCVNLLQSAGFLSRLHTHNLSLNHALGYVMLALGVPAAVALVTFVRQAAPIQQWIGALVYLIFLALMIVVDYARPVEFRDPPRPAILIPYLALFGAIVLMGLPMYRLSRPLWLVTVTTTILLVVSMLLARRAGVG